MSDLDRSIVELPSPWNAVRVAVVVPTYNEAANLPVLVDRLLALPLTGLSVLVADDASPDGTGEVADELAGRHGDRVRVLHRTGKRGLGRAYVDGMTRALADGAELVVQSDADLSHPPEYIPQMVGTLLSTRADLVIGSRYVSGGSLADDWPLYRRALSSWANFYVEKLLALRVKDMTAGFKVWQADALRRIGLDRVASDGYSFQVEMHYLAQRSGMKMVEIPIHFNERQHGESKMSLGVKVESALVPFRLRRAHRHR